MAGEPRPPAIPDCRSLSLLGERSASTLYAADSDAYGGAVTVTIYPRPGGEAERRQFDESAATARRLGGHPHVVTVHASGSTDDGRPYVVSDGHDRTTAAGLLSTGRVLAVEQVLRIGVALAGALETAHRAGVVHGSVAPDVVLLRTDSDPVLTEVGLAGFAQPGGFTIALGRHVPYHAPPEVLEDTQFTPATDVYSLASVVFTLLVGQPPHAVAGADDSTASLLLRILQMPMPSIHRSDVPPGLEDALRTALSHSPVKRGTLLELSWALQEAQRLAGLDVSEPVVLDEAALAAAASTAPSPSGPEAGPPPEWEWKPSGVTGLAGASPGPPVVFPSRSTAPALPPAAPAAPAATGLPDPFAAGGDLPARPASRAERADRPAVRPAAADLPDTAPDGYPAIDADAFDPTGVGLVDPSPAPLAGTPIDPFPPAAPGPSALPGLGGDPLAAIRPGADPPGSPTNPLATPGSTAPPDLGSPTNPLGVTGTTPPPDLGSPANPLGVTGAGAPPVNGLPGAGAGPLTGRDADAGAGPGPGSTPWWAVGTDRGTNGNGTAATHRLLDLGTGDPGGAGPGGSSNGVDNGRTPGANGHHHGPSAYTPTPVTPRETRPAPPVSPPAMPAAELRIAGAGRTASRSAEAERGRQAGGGDRRPTGADGPPISALERARLARLERQREARRDGGAGDEAPPPGAITSSRRVRSGPPATPVLVLVLVVVVLGAGAAWLVANGRGEENDNVRASPSPDTTAPVSGLAGGGERVTDLTATEIPAGVQLDWQGPEGASYMVRVLSTGEAPRSLPAGAVTALVVPAETLQAGAPYCFEVAVTPATTTAGASTATTAAGTAGAPGSTTVSSAPGAAASTPTTATPAAGAPGTTVAGGGTATTTGADPAGPTSTCIRGGTADAMRRA